MTVLNLLSASVTLARFRRQYPDHLLILHAARGVRYVAQPGHPNPFTMTPADADREALRLIPAGVPVLRIRPESGVRP